MIEMAVLKANKDGANVAILRLISDYHLSSYDQILDKIEFALSDDKNRDYTTFERVLQIENRKLHKRFLLGAAKAASSEYFRANLRRFFSHPSFGELLLHDSLWRPDGSEKDSKPVYEDGGLSEIFSAALKSGRNDNAQELLHVITGTWNSRKLYEFPQVHVTSIHENEKYSIFSMPPPPRTKPIVDFKYLSTLYLAILDQANEESFLRIPHIHNLIPSYFRTQTLEERGKLEWFELLTRSMRTGEVEEFLDILHFTASAEVLCLLLDAGLPVDMPGTYGKCRMQTPLMTAIVHKQVDKVSLLLARSAAIVPLHLHPHPGNGQYIDPVNLPLHLAAEAGHLGIMERLLNTDNSVASIEFRNAMCETALYIAVKAAMFTTLQEQDEDRPPSLLGKASKPVTESIEIIKELLKRGASHNVGDALGITPLHLAARSSSDLIAKVILRVENNSLALVNAKDYKGHTPIWYAVYEAISNSTKRNGLTMIRFLISLGADLCHRDCYGMTVLHTIIFYHLFYHSKRASKFTERYTNLIQNTIGVNELLKQQDIDVNPKCREGATPVDYMRIMYRRSLEKNVPDKTSIAFRGLSMLETAFTGKPANLCGFSNLENYGGAYAYADHYIIEQSLLMAGLEDRGPEANFDFDKDRKRTNSKYFVQVEMPK